jgi:citrate lyase subunit beta / citryl-CoA lyase
MTSWQLPGPALLFCPATRPDRFATASARADAVIVDLEDGVGHADKDMARERMLGAIGDLDLTRTIVRINPVETRAGQGDLAALLDTGVQTVMLPKAADPSQLAELGDYAVIALCETAAGVLSANELAAAENCVGLMWGGEDLIASLGGRSSRRDDGTYQDVVRLARAETLIAAAAHGKSAIDGVYLTIDDDAGLAVEAAEAGSLGFAAKACIHPKHASIIRGAFAVDDEQLGWARAVLATAKTRLGDGAFTYQGRMIDAPLLRQAEAIVAAASTAAGSHR